jgi:hypothetical protein
MNMDGMIEYDYTYIFNGMSNGDDLLVHGRIITWLMSTQQAHTYFAANVYADDWEIVSRAVNNELHYFLRTSTLELMERFKNERFI